MRHMILLATVVCSILSQQPLKASENNSEPETSGHKTTQAKFQAAMQMKALDALFASGAHEAVNDLKLTEIETQKLLKGTVDVDDSPRVAEFQDALNNDRSLPCYMSEEFRRLVRLAHSPELRKILWKRMNREELLWLKKCHKAHIEELAQMCNVPLR